MIINGMTFPVDYTYSPANTYQAFLLQSYNNIRANLVAMIRQIYLVTRINPALFPCYKNLLDTFDRNCTILYRIILLSGRRNSSAYYYLEKFLDANIGILQTLYSLPQDSDSITVKKLYRLMAKEKWTCYDLNRMFHMPFQLKKKVKDYRYSQMGRPCLYLGSSLDICLKEMNSTKKNDFYASEFWLSDNKNLRVINFSYTLQEVIDFCLSNDKDKISFFEAWWFFYPFMYACSVVQRSPTKDEYKLPQMLVQYVVDSSKLDGIRYISTKVNGGYVWTKKIMNFAIPVKADKLSGFDDDLIEKFRLSVPLNLSKVKTLQIAENKLERYKKRKIGKFYFRNIWYWLAKNVLRMK